jgi:uncharacterized protein (DUF302 family)
MKNLIFAALFFAGLLNLSAHAQPMNNSSFQDESLVIESGQNDPSAMFLENQSKYGFSETIEKLKTAIEKKTWKLTATHDLQQTLKTYGKDVLPVTVLAVCHPKHSSQILELDNERIVSCMMPCRISVYKKSDGKTYLSRINPAPMAKAYGGVVEKVMTDSANEIEEIISDIILK